MELTARYGMEFNPFLKNSKEILYCGAEYKETLFRLDYLAKTKGFGLLTGAPGRGKTTAVRNWSNALNPSLFKAIYTSLANTSINDFYRNLAVELGAEPSYRKSENFHAIRGEINRLALEKKKTPIIIIDEVHGMSSSALSDLKILFNFEMDSRDRAAILLVGLPQIRNTLRMSVHEPLRQRIIMNYVIEGYSKEEGREYIDLKLKGAGCHQTVFDEGAIEAILNGAEGTARMISKLCNASLVIGNSQDLSVITADTVMQAINDSSLD